MIVPAMITVMSIGACSSSDNDPGSNCSTSAATFTEANPIIQATCTQNSSCHGVGSNHGPGALTTYTQIFNARNSIQSAVASGSMPKTGSLSADEKNTIVCWIENGALNN
jgi:uncharacterized membrane protein